MPAPEARKTPQNARDKDHRYPKIKLRQADSSLS